MGEYRLLVAVERRRLQLADPEDEIDARRRLAIALLQYGKYEEAEPLSRSCLAARKDTLGDKLLDTLNSMNNLVNLLENMGKRDEAEPLYRSCLAAMKETMAFKG